MIHNKNDPLEELFGTLFIVALITVIAAMLYGLFYHDNRILKRVKSGEVTLICFIDGRNKIIDPSKVVGKSDEIWEFDNGYARSCYLAERVGTSL